MIASAIISGLGTAASGLMSYFNNKKAQQAADAEYARQQAYNEARAVENPLARSENAAVINEYDRKAKQQVETARNRNVITGGTPEMDLATQQAVANGRASLLSGIAAQASTRADKYRDAAENARQSKFAADQARSQQRNETYAALAANAANALGGLWTEPTSNTEAVDADAEMAEAVKQAKQKQVNQTAQTSLATNINQMKQKIASGTANMNATAERSAISAGARARQVVYDNNGRPLTNPNVWGLVES